MAMVYGHRWVSSYGEADDGTWLAGLHDVTTDQIGSGLEKCRTSKEGWPPTLPEFRAMCLPERRDPIHRDAILLPRPPQDPAVAAKHLQAAKDMLGSK